MKKLIILLIILSFTTKAFSFYNESRNTKASLNIGWVAFSNPFGFYIDVDNIFYNFGAYFSRNGDFSHDTTDKGYFYSASNGNTPEEIKDRRVAFSNKVSLTNNLGITYSLNIFTSTNNIKRGNFYSFEVSKFDVIFRAGITYFEEFMQWKEDGLLGIHNEYYGNGVSGEFWIGLRNTYEIINYSLDCGYNLASGIQYGISIGVSLSKVRVPWNTGWGSFWR